MKINEILDLIIANEKRADELEAQLKQLKADTKKLEGIAVEAIASHALDRVRYAGRTWRVDQVPHISVLKANREAVMEVAQREGIAEELTSINTTTLKAWIMERRREGSATPFDGLVSEYVETRLKSVKAPTSAAPAGADEAFGE